MLAAAVAGEGGGQGSVCQNGRRCVASRRTFLPSEKLKVHVATSRLRRDEQLALSEQGVPLVEGGAPLVEGGSVEAIEVARGKGISGRGCASPPIETTKERLTEGASVVGSRYNQE